MTDTEREALYARIDELCQEVERLHAEQAHWELGNCPSCPNVADLQEALDDNAKLIVKLNAEHIVRQNVEIENAKLRKLVLDMYRCSDPCNDCPHYNGSNDGFYCDLGIGWKARHMRELGIEVDG